MVESSALLRKAAYNQSSIQFHLHSVGFEGEFGIRYHSSVICLCDLECVYVIKLQFQC